MKDSLIQNLNQLQEEASESFRSQDSTESLYKSKVEFLGKKGKLTSILKDLGKLSNEDRPLVGAEANKIKKALEKLYDQREKSLADSQILKTLESERIDWSLPSGKEERGRLHPVSKISNEMQDIFTSMGFDVFDGPEIESDYYNFEALNIPENHPARDMQDTFYIKGDKKLLRTHTSPVQIHVMENEKPPIAMIAPGVVYRKDSDVTHTPMFHQIEGLMVDKGITMAHLKGVIELFLKKVFGEKFKIRLRPSFFPFTEPSAEVDIECVICQSKKTGCRVCSETGWLEIMGCGMVDPQVFSYVDIDPKKFSGFAFGIGVERVAMLKYGINDIRLFFENHPKFLRQF